MENPSALPQVIAEAEQRHREVLEAIVKQLQQSHLQEKQDLEIQQQRLRSEFQHYQSIISAEMGASTAQAADALRNEHAKAQAEIASLWTELQAANSRLSMFHTEANNEHQSKVQELSKNLQNEYNLKLMEVQTSTAEEYQELVRQTVEDATNGVERIRKDEKSALDAQEMRYALELQDASDQCAALQDQVDELEHRCEARVSSDEASAGLAAEPSGKPMSAFEKLRAETRSKLRIVLDNPAQHELASFSDARSDLDKGSVAPKAPAADIPAASSDRPENKKIPTLPVEGAKSLTPTEEFPSPSEGRPNRGFELPDPQKPLQNNNDILTLLTQLMTRSNEASKPKTKEADTIKLPDMPTPETYRSWKNQVKDEVRSSSDQPDAAWLWLNEVYDVRKSRQELEKELQDPGIFTTLDTKLSAALTRSAKGDLSTRILNFKEERAKVGIQVRGRAILLMFDDYFKISEEAGNLYRVEGLLNVQRVGDTLQDIKRFINKWDATLAGMPTPPEDNILRDLFLRQIRHAPSLKYDIDLFDRAKEGEENKTYQFLLTSVRNYIDRERLRTNRDRVAQRQNPNKAAAAANDRKQEDKERRRGRSSERAKPDNKKDKPCFKFREGNCKLGKKCPYSHDPRAHSEPRNPRKPSRPKTKSPPKNKTKLTKEEMAKIPCTFFKAGKCKRGDKCYYMHESTAAAAAKPKAKPRSDSPNPKKKNKEKTAPCLVQRACIAKRNRLPKPSQDVLNQGGKSVMFSNRVQYRKIPARGDMCPIIITPKVHEKVFTTEECPKVNLKTVHEAQVVARQLHEAVEMFDGDWEPACKFNCTEDHPVFLKLTCKCCRRLMEPKHIGSSPPETVQPPTTHAKPIASSSSAAAAQRNSINWLIDSGSEQDLISEEMISVAKTGDRHRIESPISLMTANGATEAREVIDTKIHGLARECQPLILQHTPAVLSVGIRCMEQGYSFVWPSGGQPILVRPDGKVTILEIDGHVPVLNESCKVVPKKFFKKDRPLQADCRNSHEFATAGVEGQPLDEQVPQGEDEAYVRSRSTIDLEQEAMSASHQFTHFPKNPFCKVCQKARMLAPQARRKGGQGRLETKDFGDRVVADHVIIKPNVEEGVNGEVVALVIKDVHTQYRSVYPSSSKSADDCIQALHHYIDPKVPVQSIYTDNSRELIAAMKDLGIRHQKSMPYVDSSKSFAEREVRQMLEGARSNLLQSGLPLRYWPLAIQHHAAAVNACQQLNGNESPWKLRFGEEFGGMKVPFGAKILFYNNPNRPDNTSGKLSPTANDGVFLGYYIQPGHQWKGEYLVAKLDALDYHAENGSITVQRSRQIILPSGGFVFPLRAAQEAKEPKAIKPQDLLIQDANREVVPNADAAEALPPPPFVYVQGNPADQTPEQPLDADAQQLYQEMSADIAAESGAPRLTPSGDPIPDNMEWDGLRLVRKRKGSQRPADIPSEFWKQMGSQDRAKFIAQEKDKKAKEQLTTQSKASGSKPSSAKASKDAAALTASQESVHTVATLCSGQWEVVPQGRPKFSVPAMPVNRTATPEQHRSSLREIVRAKIQEIEFQTAIELFANVARLVSKDEVARNPKAQEALDKEWENLRSKGVWDESRVRECRTIIDDARAAKQKVHLGRIFEACYEKGAELEPGNPLRKFKGRTVFQGNNVRDENSDHALFAELGSSPASMEAAKLLDAYGSQPGFSKQQADAIQAYIQALFDGVPTWLSLPRNRWPKHWHKLFHQPMVPLILALYGHPDSGGIWEKHLNKEIGSKGWQHILPDVWQSIFYHPEFECILVVYVDDFKLAGPTDKIDAAWKNLRSAINLGDPEPYDRYFGCHHKEFNNVTLPRNAHPFAHVFDPPTTQAASCHRTRDYWEHNAEQHTWTRHHLQPRKKFYQPGDEGGTFAQGMHSDRVTYVDVPITFKGCPLVNQVNDQVFLDNWDSHQTSVQSNEFWTGKTVFRYGQDKDAPPCPRNSKEFATPSKNRPGPHRQKREAKNEVKAQRFKPIEEAVKAKGKCVTKPVNLVRYDMSAFLSSCVEAYCDLAKVDQSKLATASTPFTEAGIARPTLSEEEKPGRLQPIASKVLMKILFAARMARYDLLRATQSLASRVTKWSAECDIALHRLVCYINSTKDLFLEGFVGDALEDCQLWLFADADHAGEHDSKSTSGCAMILVGPNTYYPLNAFSKKQTVVAVSSTEAEVVSANHAVRAEGIPLLALVEQLNIFKRNKKAAVRNDKPTSTPDSVFTRIDPEIDEIRYGNVDGGLKASDINGLVAHFPDFAKVQFMEDNQATITVTSTGTSSAMRHVNKTQNISFKWLKQQFERGLFEMINVGTIWQVADILTKAFTSPTKWQHALRLLGIGPSWIDDSAATVKMRQVDPKAAAASHQGGMESKPGSTDNCNRMLIEFCCSEDSKLCQPRPKTKGCHMIRVTEKHDGTTLRCRKWLANEVEEFRKEHPQSHLLLYASLPCVGGSPWGNVNAQTLEGSERIKEQQKEFSKLFQSLQQLLKDIKDDRTFVAFELSMQCKYWKWPVVQRFLQKHDLVPHSFHGCRFGIVGGKGLPMLKGWTIASNMDSMSVFDQYQCDGSHQHDQSRGSALKVAENYSFMLTDLVHSCFSSTVLAQAQRSKADQPRSLRACPALMASSSRQTSASDATRESVPSPAKLWPGFYDLVGNQAGWEQLFCTLACVGNTRELGLLQEGKDACLAFMSEYTCQTIAGVYLKDLDWLPNIHRLLEVDFGALENFEAPAPEEIPCIWKDANSDVVPVYVITSDSILAMVSGSKKSLRRHDLCQALSDTKRKEVWKVKHEMLWGKSLGPIVKRNIELCREAKAEFDATFAGLPHKKLQIVSLVVWSGNELVGKYGIDETGHWPYDYPEGIYPDLLADCKRHLTWYSDQLKKLGIGAAALLCEPDEEIYGSRPCGRMLHKELREAFHAELSEYPHGHIKWLVNDELPYRLVLKDHYHAEQSEANAHKMVHFILSTCLLLAVEEQVEKFSRVAFKHRRRNMNDYDQRQGWMTLEQFSDGFQQLWKRHVTPMVSTKSLDVDGEGKPFTWEEVENEQPNTMAPVDKEDIEEAESQPLDKTKPAVRENVPEYNPWDGVDTSDDKYAENYLGHRPYVSDHRDRAVAHVSGHVDSYHYRLEENVAGDQVQHVIVEGHAYELVPVTQEMMQPADGRKIWYSGHLHNHKTKFNKVLRGHGKNAGLPFDDQMFLDIEDFCVALFRELPWKDQRLSMQDIIAVMLQDGRGRFQFLGAPGMQIATRMSLSYWPFKVRCVQGHNEHAASHLKPYALAKTVYCSPYTSQEDRATFAGLPTVEGKDVDEEFTLERHYAQWPHPRRWSSSEQRKSACVLFCQGIGRRRLQVRTSSHSPDSIDDQHARSCS